MICTSYNISFKHKHTTAYTYQWQWSWSDYKKYVSLCCARRLVDGRWILVRGNRSGSGHIMSKWTLLDQCTPGKVSAGVNRHCITAFFDVFQRLFWRIARNVCQRTTSTMAKAKRKTTLTLPTTRACSRKSTPIALPAASCRQSRTNSSRTRLKPTPRVENYQRISCAGRYAQPPLQAVTARRATITPIRWCHQRQPQLPTWCDCQ